MDQPEVKGPSKSFKIAKVVDEYTVILNRGSEDGVKPGQRFLVYHIGEEITDPDSNEFLGRLETVRGTGTVTYLQSKMATIRSDMRETRPTKVIRKSGSPWAVMYGNEETVETVPPRELPFDSPKVGDLAKPV